MSFTIVDGDSTKMSGKGYILGQNLDTDSAYLVSTGQLSEFQAAELKNSYDGYVLRIVGFNSVLSYTEGNIEAICLHSRGIDGGQCAGIKHSAIENEGERWGMWTTNAQLDDAMNGSTALQGVDNSSHWYNIEAAYPLDAALGGEWQQLKFQPKEAQGYTNDYRWSPHDGAITDVFGYYYEFNGSSYRYVMGETNIRLIGALAGVADGVLALAVACLLTVAF